MGCIGEGKEAEYRGGVLCQAVWAEPSAGVGGGGGKTLPIPIPIQGIDMETVQDYTYLGVHLDNKLGCAKNTEAVYKKRQSRLYFLQRLRSFNVCSTVLRMLYQSVAARAIFLADMCLGQQDVGNNRINKFMEGWLCPGSLIPWIVIIPTLSLTGHHDSNVQ